MKPLYTVSGVVIEGKKRGNALGFPTANVLYSNNIPTGIYASKTQVHGKTYYSATFVGPSKTFYEKDIFIETYIFDFNKQIYGEEVSVQLYKKIRENKKFETVENLIFAIDKDVKKIKKYFKQQN